MTTLNKNLRAFARGLIGHTTKLIRRLLEPFASFASRADPTRRGSGVSLGVVSEDQVPGVWKILADGADQAGALVGAVPAERLAEVGRDEGTGDAEQRGDMKPDGSLEPAWRNLAITPAMKPMMIVQRMLMGPPQVVRAGNASGGTWFRRSSPDRMRLNNLGLRHVSALVRAVTLGSLSAMIPLPPLRRSIESRDRLRRVRAAEAPSGNISRRSPRSCTSTATSSEPSMAHSRSSTRSRDRKFPGQSPSLRNEQHD